MAWVDESRNEPLGKLVPMRRCRNRFGCIDCGVNTDAIGEYFMLHDEVWNAGVPESRGMLCIGCVEARLHRRLTAADFTDAPTNFRHDKSPRLLSRLWGEQWRKVVPRLIRRERRVKGKRR
jgi:hypothetical protein